MLWIWERGVESCVVGYGWRARWGFWLADLFASRVEGAKFWVAVSGLGSLWCERLMFTS